MKLIFGSFKGHFETPFVFQKVIEQIEHLKFLLKSFNNGVFVCKTDCGKISVTKQNLYCFNLSQISNLEQLCLQCGEIFGQSFQISMTNCLLKHMSHTNKTLLQLGDDIGEPFEKTSCLFGCEKAIKFLVRHKKQTWTLDFDGVSFAAHENESSQDCVSEIVISPTKAIAIKSFSLSTCLMLFGELEKYL